MSLYISVYVSVIHQSSHMPYNASVADPYTFRVKVFFIYSNPYKKKTFDRYLIFFIFFFTKSDFVRSAAQKMNLN